MRIVVEPLTEAGFAGFGTILVHAGTAPLQRFEAVQEHGAGAAAPGLSLIAAGAAALPVVMATLERHPHSAQTFLALDGSPSLVFVCGSGPDGGPRPETGRAFVAAAGQGVCYARGVWHHRLTALGAAGRFVMVMHHAADGRDTEKAALDRPVTVTAAGA